YMSPEQALGDAIDCRSDLFSLGSVLYFMLTGRPPFRADGAMAVLNRVCHRDHRPVQLVNERVPREVAQVLDHCLTKPVGERASSADELNQRFKELLSGLQAGRLSIRSLDPTPTRHVSVDWKRVLAMAAVFTLLAVAARFAIPGKSPRPSNSDSLSKQISPPSSDPFLVLSEQDFESQLRAIEVGVDQLQTQPYRSTADPFESQVRAIEAEIRRLSVDL
ncbi:MAG: serine/threonine-protein kinase, partial [Planctomycetota bacterium]